MPELSFGFSPCPNDTFAFHALAHGLLDEPLVVRPHLDDIEALNRRARRGELELTKLSFGALAQLDGGYVPLGAGAALGRGVGPLVVARERMDLGTAAAGSIAIPGHDTTAFLLLRLAAAEALGDRIVEMRYDEVLQAVVRGDVDAGLVIHESRFTYEAHGLVAICDLGEWWEHESGMPVPLAAICARADLDPETCELAERAIRASVRHAFAHPEQSEAYVREHAQELSPDVIRKHIALYVNEHTIELGRGELDAIDRLLAAARATA